MFDQSVYISVKLHRMKNRKLEILEFGRDVLYDDEISHVQDISREKEISIEDLIAKGHNIALNETLEVLKRFNCSTPIKGLLIEEQRKMLKEKP